MNDTKALREQIRNWGHSIGFEQVGFASTTLERDEQNLLSWLDADYHGEMAWMARHGTKRSRPEALRPGTLGVISARMDYLPESQAEASKVLDDAQLGYVSRYALGRDYHKVMRSKLRTLAQRISECVADFGYRVFTDSAPVMEKPLARNAGLGWIGKHTNLINRHAGSWFFLGEIYTDIPFDADMPASAHCGSCSACIKACPTGAIIAPYKLDARRCISYLTIELRGSIPEDLRPLMGNRIYGCDDCQLVCPWNRYASLTQQSDYLARPGLARPALTELIGWSAADFATKTLGSAIRRIGHECFIRNVAVALGNAPPSNEAIAALRKRSDDPSALIREHVGWALQRQRASMGSTK